MDTTATIMGGSVAAICAAGLFSIPLAIVLRAKRIICGRDASGAWLLHVDFLGRIELGGAFAWGAVRVAGTARCLPLG